MRAGSLRALSVVVVLLGLVAAPAAPARARAAAPAYELVDLGQSFDYDPADQSCVILARGAEAISANGVIVGQLKSASGRIVPAASDGAKPRLKGLAAPGAGGGARGVNAAGVVVGHVNVKSEGTVCGDYRKQVKPAMWVNGERTELPTGDFTNGRADAINDGGVIAGNVVSGEVLPARWVDGKLEVLPLLRPDSLGGNAYAINAGGTIVGSCFSVDPQSQFAYDFATVWQDGKASELDPMGGVGSVAYAINDDGVIAGGVTTTDASRAERSDAVTWTDGKAAALPRVEGSLGSMALGINAGGDVVGWSQTADGRAAVAWIAGQAVVLADVTTGADGWALWHARDIADDGTIVGWGIVDGEIHGFVLQPKA